MINRNSRSRRSLAEGHAKMREGHVLCSGRMGNPVAWKHPPMCPARDQPLGSPSLAATPFELNLHHILERGQQMMISIFRTPPAYTMHQQTSTRLYQARCTHASSSTVPIPRHWMLRVSEHAAAQPSWRLPPDVEATLHERRYMYDMIAT